MNRGFNPLAVFVLFFLLLVFAIVVASAPEKDRRIHSSILVDTDNVQVLRGAEAYYQYCAVCHGDTAKGLDEARLAFPEEHQNCERCHRPSASPLYSDNEWAGRRAFSIGVAPALHKNKTLEMQDKTADVLTAFPNGLVLYSYIKAVMPRHAPSSLEDETYLDITAFLLEANGVTIAESEVKLETILNYKF